MQEVWSEDGDPPEVLVCEDFLLVNTDLRQVAWFVNQVLWVHPGRAGMHPQDGH